MCQKCLDALNKYFLYASDELRAYILWERTSFPFGSAELIEKQIEDAFLDLKEPNP